MRPVNPPFPPEQIRDILRVIRDQYALAWSGIHGVRHWARVLENGLRLADETGADREVVLLFALFHDACRVNDDRDPGHGGRGAKLAASHQGRLFHIDGTQLALLTEACTLHTRGGTEAHTTVQTCWDADRLDLLRVGIRPAPRKLCTAAAREPVLMKWANDRARSKHSPSFAREDWMISS